MLQLLLAIATAATMAPRPNDGLTADVRHELARGLVTNNLELGIEDDNGIIVLTGTVPDLFSQKRAVERTKLVVGVRAVVDRMKLQMEPIDDQALRDDLVAALHTDPLTRNEGIGVAVKDGVVTLTGTVSSEQRRAQAVRIAERGDSVTRVVNGLQVAYAFDRSDPAIRADVISELRWDPHVDADLTMVAVHDGVVTLSGLVGSTTERDRITEDAWIAGVRAVDSNRLTVNSLFGDYDLRHEPFPVRSDGAIAQTIQQASGLDPRLLYSDLEPEVVAGVVTLMGQVNDEPARQAALELARDTVGVVQVDDDLHIVKNQAEAAPLTLGWRELWPGWTSLRDGLAAAEIRQELRWDPALAADHVKVRVVDGHALLTGRVGSAVAVLDAEHDAYDGGAESVASHLQVTKDLPGTR